MTTGAQHNSLTSMTALADELANALAVLNVTTGNDWHRALAEAVKHAACTRNDEVFAAVTGFVKGYGSLPLDERRDSLIDLLRMAGVKPR